MKTFTRILFFGSVVVFFSERCLALSPVYPPLTNDAALHLPLVGQNELHILSSNLLEVKFITTKTLAAGVDQWNFVSALGLPMFPGAAKFVVLVNSNPVPVSAVAFKRRPLY